VNAANPSGKAAEDGAIVQNKRRYAMPIVRVEMWTGRTEAQKKELARVITDAMVNIAHTTPEATIIVFEDIEKENWAQAGKLSSDD
jgi:4-oxalocrotonate tautomerase